MITVNRSPSRTPRWEGLLERLDRTFERDVKGERAIEGTQRIKRLVSARYAAAGPSAAPPGQQDIANLLQDALEEDAHDRKLTQIVIALGLVMGSVNPPRSK